MASSFGSQDDELVSQINITPLVDVVLVLLVIFLMTAPALYQSAIKVQLPKAQSGDSAGATDNPYRFTLGKDGKLLWGKRELTLADLKVSLTKTAPEVLAQATALISADQATPHGIVIGLMDTLRNAGLTRFGMSVESGTASNAGAAKTP